MNETSLKAFWENKLGRVFQPKEVKILDSLYVDGPATRAELAQRTGLKLSCVCGRVNRLLQCGSIEEFDTKKDSETNKTVNILRMRERT